MLVKNFLVLLIVAKTVFCKYEYIEELFNELKDEDGPCPGYLSNITKKLWAIKMLDATSKLPNGLLEGNVMDLGNFDECLGIEDETDEVKPKYCAWSLTITLPKDVFEKGALLYNFNMVDKPHLISKNIMHTIHKRDDNPFAQPSDVVTLLLSLCLPSTCSPSDFQGVANKISEKIGFVNIKMSDTICQTNDPPKIDTYDIVVIVIFSIIIICVILCTTYDAIIQKKQQKPAHPLLISFSFLTNGRKLIAISNNPDQLHCLNGIRFFSMMWVVTGHRYALTQGVPAIDKLFIANWSHETYSQYILAAPLAVDTFLCISGIVLSYSFLKHQRNPKAKFNLLLFYVHRYLRLTPAVAALYLLTISILKFFTVGPLFPVIIAQMKDNCLKYWWSFFLYIQNYVNMNEVCWTHTWYISMDMQMFIISPLFLWPLLKFKKYALYGMYALVVIFIIVPFVITYEYKTIMFTQDFYDYYYYVTHTRLGPWFVGLIVGVFILDTKNGEFKIHWALNLFIWTVVLTGMGAIVFTGNDIINHFEVVKNAFYLSLHKVAWSIGLCWIVFASVKGYGGIVNWFLSLPMFQVLARLTYSMYIVHIVVNRIHAGRIRTQLYLSDYDMFYIFCGDLIMTLVWAIFWTLLFESPMIIIEKVLFEPKKKKPVVADLTNVNVNVSSNNLIESLEHKPEGS